jgi:hypothetical protein
VALNAPKADADPRSDAGEGGEAMTSRELNPSYVTGAVVPVDGGLLRSY